MKMLEKINSKDKQEENKDEDEPKKETEDTKNEKKIEAKTPTPKDDNG